jgi:hypothetical protein
MWVLQDSLKIWKGRGVRGVWLKIPIENTELIPAAVRLGFKFHHAQATYAMLITWLTIEIEPCK